MAQPGAGTQAFSSTLTDLMTSLAVIFVLLLVVFLKQAHDQSKRAKDQVKEQLGLLLEEKSLALQQDATDPLSLTVMVGENQLRFPLGEYSLSRQGQDFVDQFFSSFARKICQPELREKVDSIVIEGHTDTSGERTEEGVRKNILLSQRRSFSVLERAMRSVQADKETYECLLRLSSATGRGSRKPIFAGTEYQPDQSRRVEIKIRVRSAEQQFRKIARPGA
jgi:outer membrane protein OmpA-like peptidoglycan-associated protein